MSDLPLVQPNAVAFDVTVEVVPESCPPTLHITSKAMHHEGYCRAFAVGEYVAQLASEWAYMIAIGDTGRITLETPND